MKRPLIIRPAAEEDIQRTHAALESERPGLGNRFIDRLREALQRVEDTPEIYGSVWKDVRAARLKKFRYIVYYVAADDRVEVLAVLHGSRDTSAWRTRR